MIERRHGERRGDGHRRREDELQAMLRHGSRNFRRYRRRSFLAFALLAVSTAAALGWVWSASATNTDQNARLDGLIREVQVEREQSIRRGCVEQNERHDAAVHRLDVLLGAAIRRDPDGGARLRRSRATTVALIDALVPVRDCRALVRRSVRAP